MTWLARLDVTARIAREEKIADSYSWHKRLWDCYPGNDDSKRDFLTRIDPAEGYFRAWILGKNKPVVPEWCPAECFAAKEVVPSFLSHRIYAFDLRANPTKCLVQRNKNGERKRQGKRIALIDPADLKNWLDRKAMLGGFSISDSKPLDIGPVVENYFRKKGHTGYHTGVQFRGILNVTDSEAFHKTYISGIGSAKGFGFGLLLLYPVAI